MKKETKRFLAGSVAVLSLVVAGCSQSTSTSDSAKETTQVAAYHKADVTGPAASFDWNAKVGPVSHEKTYVETNSGKSFTTTLDGVIKAQEALAEKKKEITDTKVQKALEIVDAVFVNQENFDVLVKAAGATNQEEFFDKMWNEYLVPLLSKKNSIFSNDTTFEYEGVNYPIKVYAPMFFKVNTNALGKAGAYTLEDTKVEGDMVYLKFKAPSVDTYQYEVKASYHTDTQKFFLGLVEEHEKVAQSDFAKAMDIRFVYRLAALDFKADRNVDLEGMDYLDRNQHIIAIKVDDNGNATIDQTNLANLLQIDMKPAHEANKPKFQ